MTKDEYSYYPFGVILTECPKCDGPIRYRKTHHYGPEGEWCDTCKVFIEDLVRQSFPIFIKARRGDIEGARRKFNDELKEFYREQQAGEIED